MQNYQNLTAWKKAHDLALEVYRHTTRMPSREYPGLTSQLRRAATSIAANVAEGCGHASQAEFARFLQMASASALEVDYHLLLARDLGAIDQIAFARLEAKTTQVCQLLGGLLRRVRADLRQRPIETAAHTRAKRAAHSEKRTAQSGS